MTQGDTMGRELGRLSKVDPRAVWEHEERHFTPWLAEHIDMLGEVLGLELEVVERERAVGDFSLDLLARDLGRDRVVVIENQLEPTNHTHLGQLLTYAAGLEASVIIWVSREFREEHRQALDWLNRGDGATTEYFGVVLEILQIDDSKPAVNFRLVASPNNWSRTSARAAVLDEVSGRRAAYRDFFQRLIDELREKHHFTGARVAQAQNWYTFSSGIRGFRYSASFAAGQRIRSELYIDVLDREGNLAALERLRADRVEIERAFGTSLDWEELDGRRACRIALYRPGGVEDSQDVLDEHLRWTVDQLVRFKAVFGARISKLAPSVVPGSDGANGT